MQKTKTTPLLSFDVLGRVSFVLFFLSLVFGIRSLNVWNEHFFDTGSVYIAYHVLKSLLFVISSWLIYHLGNIILVFFGRRYNNPDGSHDIVACIFTGASLLSILVLLLGLTHTLSFSAICFIMSLLCWHSFGSLKIKILKISPHVLFKNGSGLISNGFIFSISMTCFWLLVICSGVYIFLAKGLCGDIGGVGGEAISYYIPYFQEIRETSSLWPAVYFSTYYVVKGTGLLILFSQLTDVQSLQLATCLYFFTTSIILYRAVRLHTDGSALFGLLAVAAFFCDHDNFVANFSKSHIIDTAYILSAYWFAFKTFKQDKIFISDRVVLFISTINVGLLPLINVFFCFSVLGFLFIAAILQRKTLPAVHVFTGLVSLALSTLGMCALNHSITGLYDVTGITYMFKFANEAALSEWASPLLVSLYKNLFNIHNATLSLKVFFSHFNLQNISYFFWDKTFLPAILVIPAYIWTTTRTKNTNGLLRENQFSLLLYFSIMLVPFLCASLYINDHYFSHGTVYFKIYFKIIIYTIATYAIFKNLCCTSAGHRFLYHTPYILPFITITFIYAHYPQNIRDDMREVFEFTSGKASYEKRYASFYTEIPTCSLIMNDLSGKDGFILPLNHFADCNGIPGSIFTDAQSPPFGRDFDSIIGGDFNTAKHVLLSHNIRYFLFQLDKAPNYCYYMNIFSTESVRSHFKLVKKYGDHLYLLTWKDDNDPVQLPEEFLKQLAEYMAANAQSDTARMMENVMSSLPDDARPGPKAAPGPGNAE